jgi:hypothetical protein
MYYADAYICCDCALQVATSHGLPPTPARRMLFILYQTTVPYLAERIRYVSRKFKYAPLTNVLFAGRS